MYCALNGYDDSRSSYCNENTGKCHYDCVNPVEPETSCNGELCTCLDRTCQDADFLFCKGVECKNDGCRHHCDDGIPSDIPCRQGDWYCRDFENSACHAAGYGDAIQAQCNIPTNTCNYLCKDPPPPKPDIPIKNGTVDHCDKVRCKLNHKNCIDKGYDFAYASHCNNGVCEMLCANGHKYVNECRPECCQCSDHACREQGYGGCIQNYCLDGTCYLQCEPKIPPCDPLKCKCDDRKCIRRGYDKCVNTYCCGSHCEVQCIVEDNCANKTCTCDENYCRSIGKECGRAICKDGQCVNTCKAPCRQMCHEYCNCESDKLCGHKAKCEYAYCDNENSCQFACNGTDYHKPHKPDIAFLTTLKPKIGHGKPHRRLGSVWKH